MYDMSGFNYDITDVVHLLQLRVRHKNSSSMDVNCPFCGETKGKMNVNLQKNVFRCNRCDASGGMLELYGRLHGVSSAEANRQIREALGKGEYRTNYQVAPKKEPVVIFNAELADADVIDRTYQEMLSLLTLNDKHQEDLKKRGLTEEQIEIQRYRSVPLFGIKNMVQKLLESGQTVKGVPGFYEDQDGKWTINFSSKNSGILIPIQSPEGKIQGFQIRLDQVMEGRKYIWLSSVKFKNGVSSGSPVHVIGNLDAEQIYLTEGALKGTIAHYLSGDTFICVAGVNQYRNLKPVLEMLKSRHLQHLWTESTYVNRRISLMRGSAMRESVTDVRIILECLQEAYQMEGDMVRSGKNIHATMIYPFVRMLQEKCRDLTEEQIHKTLWKEYEISGADRMFVERASKILEPYEGESEDEK